MTYWAAAFDSIQFIPRATLFIPYTVYNIILQFLPRSNDVNEKRLERLSENCILLLLLVLLLLLSLFLLLLILLLLLQMKD